MNNTHIEVAENLFELLESDYILYYEKLCDLENLYDKNIIEFIVNHTSYNYYFGNQLHALIYVTGDLKEKPSQQHMNFYGSETYVPEEVSIKILDKLVLYNIDLYQINYYNENLLENINYEGGLTKRINNNNFKKKLHDIFISNFIHCLNINVEVNINLSL